MAKSPSIKVRVGGRGSISLLFGLDNIYVWDVHESRKDSHLSFRTAMRSVKLIINGAKSPSMKVG